MKATTLTERGDAAMQRLAVLVLAVVGAAAAVQSWSHLSALAVTAGVAPGHGWLFALSVDGLICAGTLTVLHSTMSGAGTRVAWSLVLLGSALSLLGNLASAEPSLLSAVVHGVPAVVLIASVETVMHMKRNRWAATVAEAQSLVQEKVAQVRRAERAQKRAAAAETRAARTAAAEGLTARAAVYRDALVGLAGSTLTEQAVGVLTLHDARFGGRVPASDVALALGTDITRARKAIERARVKMREDAQPQRLLTAVATG